MSKFLLTKSQDILIRPEMPKLFVDVTTATNAFFHPSPIHFKIESTSTWSSQ